MFNRSSYYVVAALALAGCGDDQSTGGDGPAGVFDACGGKIFDSSGAFSASEYTKQARLWDRATLDCRLGPKFDYYHPDDADDARPTAIEIPIFPNTGSSHLCPNFNHDTPGPAGYGSTSGQVAYAPDDPTDPGLDRIQTAGWEGPGECYQPQQHDKLGGTHPDGALVEWKKTQDVGVPIAKGRTEYAETGDGIVIFSNGFIGATGTVSSGSTHPTFQLPPNKVPTAVAVTNYNELALVTIWDTDELKAQVAVFALRADKPPAFSIKLHAAPNEAGFNSIQLLGYVDLPDMKTPTAISAAGNNQGHQGPWIQDGSPHSYAGVGTIFEDLSYSSMINNNGLWVWTSDPKTEPGLFGNAGAAIIASRWENKVTFLDLEPLYTFVRSVYIEPIEMQNEAKWIEATTTLPWPYDFSTNPEMMPRVVTTIAVDHPTVVRMGIAPTTSDGFTSKLLAWVGGLDGVIHAYDASQLAGRGNTDPITLLAEVQADPNPTSLHLSGRNNSLFLSSRGNRSVQWISASKTAVTIDRTFRDSRVNDPVATDHNQRVGHLLTIGDFTAGTVSSFESDCPDDQPCTWSYDGSVTLPGAVYLIDTANVN